MIKVLKYVSLDILKNKVVIIYTIMLAMFSWSAFGLEDSASKGILTTLNIILLTVPLISILFSTIYIYNSSEFIELLVSHPVKRSMIWNAIFTGLAGSLAIAFILGAGIPILLFTNIETAFTMLATGVLLTVIFVAIAFLASVSTRDKAKGIGIAILLWLYFALLFDGLVLFLFFQFSDYPIEKAAVLMTAFSPVDLSRILILLHLDVSAMMGYTGAVFKRFFGTGTGLAISFLLLILWVVIPYYFSLRKFRKKDL